MMAVDSLFVIGRNIYQAACGRATAACRFVESFVTTTSSFPDTKRKAILDGMLFEIFFGPEANPTVAVFVSDVPAARRPDEPAATATMR
jgi:hypothetical protein